MVRRRRADPPTWMTVAHSTSCIFFLTVLPMEAILPSLTKLPQIMFSLIQKVLQLTVCLKVLYLDYGTLSHPKNCTANPINNTMVKHIHTPQMPISAQQWRNAVGRVNASRSLRPRVTGQPRMKLTLTSLDILVFILTTLLGAILSNIGGREAGERSE